MRLLRNSITAAIAAVSVSLSIYTLAAPMDFHWRLKGLSADQGEDNTAGCDAESLVLGQAYTTGCGLDELSTTVYYVGEWNGEPLFFTEDLGGNPKHVGIAGQVDNGYENTVALVEKYGLNEIWGHHYAAWACLKWEGTVFDEHGFFLPSHGQLARLWDGSLSEDFTHDVLGLGTSSYIRTVLSDEGGRWGRGPGMLLSSAGGHLKIPEFEGDGGETFCAVTPSSIEASKLR